MISIVLSKSVDKSNTKYYDVVIKWVNITTSIVSIDKRYTSVSRCIYKVIKYCYANSKHRQNTYFALWRGYKGSLNVLPITNYQLTIIFTATAPKPYN